MINQINSLIGSYLDAHPMIRIVSVIICLIGMLATTVVYLKSDKPTPMKNALVRIKKERKAARKSAHMEGVYIYDSEAYHNR